jgi:glycosyltransferase involved in cell wall biosynthesis
VVRSVPLYASQEGFARRIASYLTFAATAAGLGPRYCRRPDLIWVESPPLFIGVAARVRARRWRRPYVFNVSDRWPESAIRMGVIDRGAMASAAERFELSLYRAAAGVTGQSHEIVDSVRRRAPGVQVVLIANGVDTQRFGADSLDARVRLVPPLPRARIPALLAAADVALVSLGLALTGAAPSKICEAMAARLPILLVADAEPARRVEEAERGLVSAPGDRATLRANFERLAHDSELRAQLGAAGRRAAETTYDRRRIAEQLDAFLRSRLEAARASTRSSV